MQDRLTRGDKLIRLPIDSVRVSADQPRRAFSPDALARLAESIRQVGLLSPVVVRRVGNAYELIAGERRLRAVKMLGYTVIDAFVVTVDAREAALIQLIENIQREQLHYLEEAAAYRRMLTEFSFSQEVLARRLGVSQPAIANKLRLLKLPETVRVALTETALTERHARALLAIEGEERQLLAVQRADSERMSVRQLEALAERFRGQTDPMRPYRLHLRDQRMVINAVLNTVKALNTAGIMATSRVEELPDRTDVIVSLPAMMRR